MWNRISDVGGGGGRGRSTPSIILKHTKSHRSKTMGVIKQVASVNCSKSDLRAFKRCVRVFKGERGGRGGVTDSA